MKKNKNAMFKLKRDNDKIFSANNRGSLSQNNANSDEKKKDSSKIRVIVCVILLVVIFGGFALRLFDWQIVHGDEYKELSAASTAHTVQSDATRGEILDVNGTQVAVNETAYNIVINKVYASEDSDLNLIIINLLNTLNECGEDYIDELPISIQDGGFVFDEGSEGDVEYIESPVMLNKEGLSAGEIIDGLAKRYHADNIEDPFTKRQVALFKSIVAACAKEGIAFRKVHMAASDAINNFPETARSPFTMVRTGINLHGSFDPNGRKALKVEPVLSLKTRVAQVRELPAGTTLGYGRTWCLAAPTKVATISAGYADGLPLALTNRGFVFIGGRRCKIIGRISMDYTTVDVSDVPDVKPGDEVVCFGACGRDSITPDDWAELKGTHAYDVICSLGSRVQRVVVP